MVEAETDDRNEEGCDAVQELRLVGSCRWRWSRVIEAEKWHKTQEKGDDASDEDR
jgi:hypothetical protein